MAPPRPDQNKAKGGVRNRHVIKVSRAKIHTYMEEEAVPVQFKKSKIKRNRTERRKRERPSSDEGLSYAQ